MLLLFAAISIFITTFFIVNSFNKEEKKDDSKEDARKSDRKSVVSPKRELVADMLPLPGPARERVRTSGGGIRIGGSRARGGPGKNISSVKAR